MSVQVELPPPAAANFKSAERRRSFSMLSDASAAARNNNNTGKVINLSNPNAASSLLLRRESLKLSFNRSISEPHHQRPTQPGLTLTINNEPLSSPPSSTPSLHPSKRCRMDFRLGDTMPCPASPASTGSSSGSSICSSSSGSSSNLLRPPSIGSTLSLGSVSLPASPCSESSTLQRTLLLQNARTLAPHQLAAKMESNKANFLVVDCRPFIAYNVSHLRGAINVNCCDRFNRKRLQQGKASLADLATTREGKEALRKRTWREVVVYDDCSDSLEGLPSSHTLFLVMNALVEDGREPTMLLGGVRDFQARHRALCEDALMDQPAAAAELMPPPSAFLDSPSSLLPELPSPTFSKDIENHPASQVLPHLYLGNARDAADVATLRRNGIRFVLNVTTAAPPAYATGGAGADDNEEAIVYKQLHAADNGVQNLRQFFEEAFGFIDLARAAESACLVHCHAGVSRSPTIAVAYLMQRYPVAMGEAYKYVKARRSIISPNLNFMGQLYEYEQGLKKEAVKEREPLTEDMTRVLSAKKAFSFTSSFSSSSSCSFFGGSSASSSRSSSTSEGSGAAPPLTASVATAAAAFRWSTASSQQQHQLSEVLEEAAPANNGCGV